MAEYIVIGGGITGLASAWELVSAGHQVTVVESDDFFGGKISTLATDGYLIERGPDSVVAYRPAALDLAREVGLGAEIVKVREPRSVFLRVDGKLLPMPSAMGLVLPTRLGPFVTTPVLSWRAKLRATADLLLPRSLSKDDQSIGALLRRRLGPGVVQRIADPLLGGVYGASVDELSLDAVVPSLRTAEAQHRSLLLASLAQGRASRQGSSPSGSPFRSLSNGMGSLVEALVDALTRKGAQLLSRWPVTQLTRSAGGWTAQGPEGQLLSAAGVILACGATATARLLGPIAPGASAQLKAIPLGSTTVITFGWPRSAFSEPPVGHGHLEAGPDRAPISGVTISSNKWPRRAPADKVALRAFVPDRVGPIASAPETELLKAVVGHVSRIYRVNGQPEMVQIQRWDACMPKYVVGHPQRVAQVAAELAALPGLVVAGSALHGVGVPDCVADGRRAARKLADPEAPQPEPTGDPRNSPQ
jgi:oxygen-dependent protoporphyrinogen oxidase